MQYSRKKILIICTILSVHSLPRTASADLLGFFVGETIDDTTERIDSMITRHSNKLLGKADQYVDRLETLVSVTMNEGFNQAELLRKKTFDDLKKLEQDVNDDVMKLVFETECAARRLSTDAPRSAIESAARTVKDLNPSMSLDLFNKWTLFSVTPEVRKDPSGTYTIAPDVAYYEFKKDMLSDLQQKYGKNEGALLPAYPINKTLASLSELARQTACYFPGNSGMERRFIQEHSSMAGKSAAWSEVVYVEYAK